MADKLSLASSDFALNLLRTACSPEKNGFFSPMSISVALAMTYAGADGETKKQMNEQLFGGLNDDKIHKGFSQAVSFLNEPKENYELRTVNKIYGQQGYALQPDFIKILMTHYQSEMKSVDFENASEAARMEINTWVEQVTKSRIKDLIAPRILDELTRLVLVNAIYFKGNWKKQFKEHSTILKTFYSVPARSSSVQMMRQTEEFLYNEEGDVQILGMPYVAQNIGMFVFLPKERYGLADFEKKLTGERVLRLISNCQLTKVKVEFPKFKMEQSFSLKDALSSLGMPLMFDPNDADFSKLTGDKDLYVSEVLHKAFIEVNEEGTEAAAATAVICSLFGSAPMPPPIPSFIADHSFDLFIFEQYHYTPLFLGHFVN